MATAAAGFFGHVAWTQIEFLQVRQKAASCEQRLNELEGKSKKTEGKVVTYEFH